MKNLLAYTLFICLVTLSQSDAWAFTSHHEDTLTTKYFAGFATEQKMNNALKDVLAQKDFQFKDSIPLNIGLRLANQANDSLKFAKKQIADFKIETNNYNTKHLEILRSQNSAMLQVSKKIISAANSNIKKLNDQRKKNKAIRKANDKAVDGFLAGLKYYDTKFSANAKPEDTLNILRRLDLMNDSVKIYTDEYLSQVKEFNSTYDSLMQHTNTYQTHTLKGISTLEKIIAIRKENVQNSDFTIETQKKNWQKFQSTNNQLLFFKNNFLTDTLLHQFKRIQQNHFKVIAIQKQILKQNKKLRRYKQENQSLIQGYLDVSNSMQTFLYRHNDLVRLCSSKCNHLKKELKNIVKVSQRENEQLNDEIIIAKANKSIRSKTVAALSSAENKIITAHSINCLKQIKAVQRAKEKLYK